jgi:succinate-semialdehyde dehydrogenase/glutarate-semialdehyde dehydrogenase
MTTLEEDKAMTYQSATLYDGQILKTLEELSGNLLETTLENAATSSETGRHTTFATRAAVVAKTAANRGEYVSERIHQPADLV